MSVVSEVSLETGVAARGVDSGSSPAFTCSCSAAGSDSAAVCDSAAGCDSAGGSSSTSNSDSFSAASAACYSRLDVILSARVVTSFSTTSSSLPVNRIPSAKLAQAAATLSTTLKDFIYLIL